MSDSNNIIVKLSGKLIYKGEEFKCAIGREGVTADKKEGDKATPAGCFPIHKIYFRKDRLGDIKSKLPAKALEPSDGWCDDPDDPKYNKLIKLPYGASHETLWRKDGLYDVIVALGYNDDPPVPGKGSAIFMHVARPGYSPTAGCIALALPDLLKILEQVGKDTQVCVEE